MRSIEFHVHGPIQHRARKGHEKSIYTVFPSLNEVIDRARANKFASANEKRHLTELVATQAKAEMYERSWTPPDVPVSVSFTWHEPTMRRDADNIASAQKFVLDGLVMSGMLRGDSRKYVPQPPTNIIIQDKQHPGVDIRIEKL